MAAAKRAQKKPEPDTPTRLLEKSAVCDHGPTINRWPFLASSVIPFLRIPVK